MSAAGQGLAERILPGVRAARTYQRAWLRADLIAGVVLAAILVPQGMAYAELAGVPAVTGLYTTIACLVGYALFGPSRVLVLGPDSSILPLILAAITPLLAGGGPATAIALAGMLAILVGLTEIGLGLGKLGFVADLLSKEVQVGYMNGLGITIIVGQLPKLFGFSTPADSFLAELRAFVENLGHDAYSDADRRPRGPRRAARAAADHETAARCAWWPSSARPSSRPCSASLNMALRPWGSATGGSHAVDPVDQGERCSPAADRRMGDHARVAHRHDRDRDELRGPPW